MPNVPGVAESPLPGTVLTPNTAEEDFIPQADELAQFGQTMDKPKPDAGQSPAPLAEDQKRFEYWQSEAQKAQNKLKEVETQLAVKSKYDPLIDVLQKDDVSYQFLQNRLSGNRTPDKPLEPPQIPPGYNEVEAFSNPESASFKYRKEKESYLDQRLIQVEKKNQELVQIREQERTMLQQQQANREKLMQYKQQIVTLGIPEEQFNDFFDWQNKATPEELVELYKYSKSRSTTSSTGVPRFDLPLASSASSTRPGKVGSLDGLVELSRRM